MNKVVRTRLDAGGRVVIPAEFRREMGICPGDGLILRLVDGEVQMFTPEHGIRRAQEIVRRRIPEGRMLSEELIAERRAEAARE